MHPEPRISHRATGVLMIAVPALFTLCFTALQMKFDYPDILRRPADEVLSRFHSDRATLLPLWYGMFASAALFVVLAVRTATRPGSSAGLRPGLLVAGVLAGLVQAIGLARWVFAVPALATAYAAENSTPEKRAAIEVAMETLNAILGVGIGEHLGYACTAAWTGLLAHSIRLTTPRLALIGAACAFGIAAGMLEPFGIPTAGAVNAIAYSAWSVWLIVIGVLMLRGRDVFAASRPG